MEQNSRLSLLSYLDAVARSRTGATRQVEVPIGHAVSLPMPTRCFGIPAYAAFASPAVREPEKPVLQGPPDRWWLLDAHTGAVALFALWSIYRFAETPFATVTLPHPVGTVAELRQELTDIQTQMDALAPRFLRSENGEPDARHLLYQALKGRIPQVLWSQYEALAPDFLGWLVL
jgi:hypothetical protein